MKRPLALMEGCRYSATIPVQIALLVFVATAGCSGSGDDKVPSSDSDAATSDAAADSGASVDAVSGEMTTSGDGSADSNATQVDAANDSGPSDAAVAVDSPKDTPPPACPILQLTPAPAGAARSLGYSGTDAAYNALYGSACQVASDCAPACMAAGGTMASCASGSECLAGSDPDGGLGCLPPTYWFTVSGALSESNMTTNAAQSVLVAIPYADALVLTNFNVSIPDSATITGIQFKVRRSTIAGNAVDDTVQILQNGAPVGTNHGRAGGWPGLLTYASYGGAYDTWGTSWTAADIRSTNFGISIAAKYTGPSAGNERAYIDSVRVTVFYTAPCD